MKFTGVRVFSATRHEDRAVLGERVTDWMTSRRGTIEIVDIVQRQSSDSAYHLISVVVFFNEPGKASIDHIVKGRTAARRLSFNEDG